MPLILVIEEPGGKRWTRQVSNTLVIGRDPKVAQLVLLDDYVSRNHATITRRSNGQWLYIHHGRNASRLDDAIITGLREQVVIRDQSRLKLGSYRVTFISDEEPATEILASRHMDLDQLEDVLEPEQRVDSGLSSSYSEGNQLDATLLDVQIPLGEDSPARDVGIHPVRSTRVELHGLVDVTEVTQARAGAEANVGPSASVQSGSSPHAQASGPFETMDFSELAVRLREQQTPPAKRGLARLTHFLKALWQRFRPSA